MIDFHSHFLPQMDDGAGSVEESAEMVRRTVEQNIKTVVATPHFHLPQESINSFLERRYHSASLLREVLSSEKIPQIFLGAEVQICSGLSRQDLHPLCMEGTDILLLELPFMRIPDWVIEEVENIIYAQNIRVMYAHLERYFDLLSDDQLRELLGFPNTVVQITGETVLDRFAFRRLRRRLSEADSVVLGSDMHHSSGRTQNLGTVSDRLQKSFTGRRWLSFIEQSEKSLFA